MIQSLRKLGPRWFGGGVLLAVAVGAIGNIPVSSKQGVNFELRTHRLPLYLKGLQFVDRHAQYRQLAEEITNGLGAEQERVMAVYSWTKRNVRTTPDGWPIVDDHILNIIIRGHGAPDQQADVFTTVSTYAGVPAFWTKVKARGAKDGVILSFVRVGNRWVVFDVFNGFVFRSRNGSLATAEEIAADPAALPDAALAMTVGTTPYPRIFEGMRTPPLPHPLRAELQMPWPRLRYEAACAVGLERDNEPER